MRRGRTVALVGLVLLASAFVVVTTLGDSGAGPAASTETADRIPADAIESRGGTAGDSLRAAGEGPTATPPDRERPDGIGFVPALDAFAGDGEPAGVDNGTGDGSDLAEYDSDNDGLNDAAEQANGTNAFVSDTDGDGIRDGREVALGTDPTEADTDGDGTSDPLELERGTSPVSTDGDGDGVRGAVELRIGTDPAVADTDGDGLDDGAERQVGTDPTVADTDGDGLDDGWEFYDETPGGAALPDSDPLSKDLYVRVDYAPEAEMRSEAFYDDIERAFATMPVDNADGDTGIDVHVSEGRRLNASLAYDGDNFWSLRERYYDGRFDAGSGVYHQVVVAPFSTDDVGYGEVGGEFSVVAADADTDTQRHVVVHELLHNVVGDIQAPGVCPGDPHHYCDGGWLTPRITPGEDEYLPEAIATELERDGFVEE